MRTHLSKSHKAVMALLALVIGARPPEVPTISYCIRLPLTEQINDISIIDADADGISDIFLSIGPSTDAIIRPEGIESIYLHNDGAGRFSIDEKHPLSQLKGDAAYSTAADFNQDGYDDILVTFREPISSRNLTRLFLGTDHGIGDPADLPPELAQHRWMGMAAVDLLGDNGSELFCFDTRGWQVWSWTAGSFARLQNEVGASTPPPGYYRDFPPRISVTDIDCDGDLDILVLVTTQMSWARIDTLINDAGILTRQAPSYWNENLRDIHALPPRGECDSRIAVSKARFLPNSDITSMVLTWDHDLGLQNSTDPLPEILSVESWALTSLRTIDESVGIAVATQHDLRFEFHDKEISLAPGEEFAACGHLGGRHSILFSADLGGSQDNQDFVLGGHTGLFVFTW